MKNLYQFIIDNPLPDVDRPLRELYTFAKHPENFHRDTLTQVLKMGKGNDEYHVYIHGLEMGVLEAFKLCLHLKLMIERWGLE